MNKFAVIKTGGKQYLVKEKQTLEIEKIKSGKDNKIELTEVLLVTDEQRLLIGKPFVKGAKVIVQVQKQFKNKKIKVIKFKAKSRYRRKKGHRQAKTQLMIDKIILPGKKNREK